MPLKNLNSDQLSAVKTNQGHNLIIASAGTGKTSTIVGRIAYLIQSGVMPERILLLTFTNKAAAEMIARVAKFFGEDVAKRIQAGTFHAVSYRWLKKYNNKEVSLKRPKELKLLLKTIYDKRSFSNFSEEKTKHYQFSHLYDTYSLYLNSSKNESFTEWMMEKKPEHEIYLDIYNDILDEYKELKKKYGYANFDDLLIFAKDLIKEKEINYEEVLVDEYQDTNPLQNSLINALKPNSLFCVGDYDQSIYGFNGSDISIISSFSEVYQNAKVFTLKQNYRSTEKILKLANDVIKNNLRVYPKELEVVRRDKNLMPQLITSNDVRDQYKTVAEKIIQSKTPHNEIAVIFRNNATADGVEAVLREHHIPSKRKGSLSFFESKEVKLFLDIATILANPKDMMAFIHIFEYTKGVGSAISKELFDALSILGDGNVLKGLFNPKEIANPFNSKKNIQLGLFDDYFVLEKASRFEHIISMDDREFLKNPILKHPKLNSDAVKFIYDFFILFKSLKGIENPISIINTIFKSNFFKEIKNTISTKRAISKSGEVNEALKEAASMKIDVRIDTLKEIAKNYEELPRFLNALILTNSEMSEGNGVNLLTVHASKGLEFKEVFVVDLMEGRFPNTKLIAKGSSLEEERRLFYVAVTRAKDVLYLSFAKFDKFRNLTYEPSCFLSEAKLV